MEAQHTAQPEKTGSEAFCFEGQIFRITILDYWSWDNNNRRINMG